MKKIGVARPVTEQRIKAISKGVAFLLLWLDNVAMAKQKKIGRLQFCYIDEEYADFLRSRYDKRVPNTKSNDYKYTQS